MNNAGEKVGSHKGYPFFTIGQRRGIGTAFGKPMYVINTSAKSNQVTVGEEHELLAEGFLAKSLNLIKYERLPEQGLQATIKIGFTVQIIFQPHSFVAIPPR